MDPPVEPTRKRPAHGVLHPGQRSLIVFLTVCTKDRNPWLDSPEVHTALISIWQDSRHWLVGRYVLLPDHLHLFAAPGEMESDFDDWVRYWKRQFTRYHGGENRRWQESHWDTRLRSGESYEEKWEYVRANPVRHGLTLSTDEWPYQGELHPLPW